MDGIKRLYGDNEVGLYYLTVENENYDMPNMPEGVEDGIIKGIYRLKSQEVKGARGRVQLFGTGAILRSVLGAQQILAERYQIASDVWSVTSYTELRRDAQSCHRWNLLHPDAPPKVSYLEETLAGVEGPIVAASDYVRAWGEQLSPYIKQDYYVLGTDGMGRSETREALRRHFEVDQEFVTLAALYRLSMAGKLDRAEVARAVTDLGIDPDKPNPLFA